MFDAAKRAVDIVVSGAALSVGAPVYGLVALLVRLRLGRPVLFSQERAGLGGEVFKMYKFRSMIEGAGTDEERLTPFGLALRATSLDELPSMINVFRGEMSLVGPRPLLPGYLPLYTEDQARRHNVRPGLTGLAQISGRNLLSWEERFELDVDYVETASLAVDAKILLGTVKKVLAREGVASASEATMSRFTGSES